MAMGGGIFTSMNKIMPGSYINYVSAARASSALSDRGYAALPLVLNWGADEVVIEMTVDELEESSMKVFGYAYDADEMRPVREVFRHANTCYFYKLNGGNKAECSISTARYKGIRGNDIRHVVTVNVDDAEKFDVMTYVGTELVDSQTVGTSTELVDNEFVVFKKTQLSATAGENLTGGSNAEVTGTEHQKALDALELYAFNTLGCMSATDAVIALYVAFEKRMRDKVGVKFVLAAYRKAADYIGVINVKNTVTDANTDVYALIPWVVGAEAGCAVNKSCENMEYDGEYTINTAFKQTELEAAIKAGEFVFHKDGNKVKVLKDINSFVTTTKEMNEDFSLNQVVRVIDQIATSETAAFNNNYLGKVQNDEDGRVSLWSDFVSIHQELLKLHAIENFEADDITVEKGADKVSVACYGYVQPVCAMSKLYMTICVR